MRGLPVAPQAQLLSHRHRRKVLAQEHTAQAQRRHLGRLRVVVDSPSGIAFVLVEDRAAMGVRPQRLLRCFRIGSYLVAKAILTPRPLLDRVLPFGGRRRRSRQPCHSCVGFSWQNREQEQASWDGQNVPQPDVGIFSRSSNFFCLESYHDQSSDRRGATPFARK